TIDISRGVSDRLPSIGSIAHQSAVHSVVTERVNCRQGVARRKPDYELAVICNASHRYNHASVASAREHCEAPLNFIGIANAQGSELNPQRLRHCLDCAELTDATRRGGIAKNGHTRYVRGNLFKQFEPFPAKAIFETRETGGIAPRPRKTLNE